MESQALRRNAKVVALHDDDICLGERIYRSFQNRQLEPVRVELEKVRTVELPRAHLRVDSSHRQLNIRSRRPGIRCLAAERLGCIEEDMARLLTRSSKHKVRILVLCAVLAQRSLVHRLRFDQKIL